MSLFGKMKPSRIIKKALNGLSGYREATQLEQKAKYLEIINKNFGRMTDILYKKIEDEEINTRALQLINDITATNFVIEGLLNLQNLPVEQRKQYAMIFTGSVAYKNNGDSPMIKYIVEDPEIIDTLIHCYDHPELAITTGEMLRVCSSYEPLCKQILSRKNIEQLVKYFTVPHFDVAADSFSFYKELIISSQCSQEYIKNNFEFIVDKLNHFLEDINYASCLQSLKLTRELIEKNQHFKVNYLANENNFDLILHHFTSQYKNIAIESLKIYKLFIDYDKAPQKVINFTKENKESLKKFADALLDSPFDQTFRTDFIQQIQKFD
ncbi:hypothetical protein TVAG_344500 [Trichomonas vaginalis G3]|uniref:Uncharacterized protein n=1 Tax=Trichomonas vaginalis (strain ATCC PRA-98 / G3) TaxID=412133 RepID=A2FRG4_TRIV3|nr:positive regulation of peptidyl-threonine phosphorylation [Trichomonas vaginalis G3]EAX92494.1 hypothetical protein TVAG_344500 [Trichomonas vaginalis G3]KAI5498296.1 positive regulation of peptidyl-threonine phosphorylation [Trichomonas vaginalis G3]|eukprot:XP_001305424.1 hypothetical protein [Trichomonas vaginalis G3]